MLPPPGPETIRLATWIFSTLALATVTLRMHTRTFIVRSLGWDDLTVVLAMFSSLGLSLLWSFQISYGLGQHLASIPPEYWNVNVRMTWAALFPYYASLCLVKVSALLQMLRIFKIPRVRTSILCLLAFVAVFGIWTFVSALLTCHPLAYMWDQTIPGGHCINQLPFLYANAAINIALDILVTLLPLPVLRRLRLTPRQKRGLMAVFALGLLATTTSIIRLRALTDLHNASSDFTHAITPLCIWSAIELNTSIACACAPALGPLFTRLASTLHLFRTARRSDLSVALSAASTCACPSLRAELSLSFAWRKSAHVSVARPRDSVDTDLTDLAEFAGFTGLTGDPDLDGFLLARQASRNDAAARRWARPDTGSTTVDEGEVDRASSTVGIV